MHKLRKIKCKRRDHIQPPRINANQGNIKKWCPLGTWPSTWPLRCCGSQQKTFDPPHWFKFVKHILVCNIHDFFRVQRFVSDVNNLDYLCLTSSTWRLYVLLTLRVGLHVLDGWVHAVHEKVWSLHHCWYLILCIVSVYKSKHIKII